MVSIQGQPITLHYMLERQSGMARMLQGGLGSSQRLKSQLVQTGIASIKGSSKCTMKYDCYAFLLWKMSSGDTGNAISSPRAGALQYSSDQQAPATGLLTTICYLHS